MRRLVTALSLLVLAASAAWGNGVGIVDAVNGTWLTLLSSDVQVDVESQIATTTARQVFRNDGTDPVVIKYTFPLPGGASATSLRWEIYGQHYTAEIAATPQDTTQPGPPGQMCAALKSYVGDAPLYFDIENEIVKDSTITIEVQYVELLPYAFGSVDFTYPNDYSLLQAATLDSQSFEFRLSSPRTIDAAFMLGGHAPDSISSDANSAFLSVHLADQAANADYQVRYRLAADELGLYAYSTLLPDSTLPDDKGGFFLFIAEPDPSETASAIDKVFTLIVDRSGSMIGTKMEQARNAASFIVNSLNPGDRFNIVDFASSASVFRTLHVENTEANRDAALAYISGLVATGGTNISEAFSVAVPQFASAPEGAANIVIFITDGDPTYGITDTEGIVTHVANLASGTEKDISVFTFGVGALVNTQLLTRLAAENSGVAAFLGSDELETVVSSFYNTIRSPVMLNPALQFSSTAIHEVYPGELPNLYRGQQLIVSGRYQEPGALTIALNGEAYGQAVQHQYQITLADSAAEDNRFLPKIWAKQKIEDLLVQYNSLAPTAPQAEVLKSAIIAISVGYGVISPFTSFTDQPTSVDEDLTADATRRAGPVELLGNAPNPFNPVTMIRFRVNENLSGNVVVRIYNSLGQVVRVLAIAVNGPGVYELTWNGLTQEGAPAASGMYIYVVDYGEGLAAGRMHLVR